MLPCVPRGTVTSTRSALRTFRRDNFLDIGILRIRAERLNASNGKPEALPEHLLVFVCVSAEHAQITVSPCLNVAAAGYQGVSCSAVRNRLA